MSVDSPVSQAGQDVRHARDVWGSALTVLIAAIALQRSFSYGIEGRTQVVGPGMFPAIASSALLLFGLLWAWQTWRNSVPPPEDLIEWPDAQGYRRIAITVAVMLVPALVFDLIDFRLTIFVMTFVILRWVFSSTLALSAAVGIGVSAVCYFGLALGLGMVLPVSF